MKEIMKRLLEVFLICHFVISMGIGIAGSIIKQGIVLTYEDLFEPAIMALLCTVPTLLTIRTDELSIKQLVFRKIIQIFIVEWIILAMIYFGMNGFQSEGEFLIVFIMVLFVFAGISLLDWVSSYLEAKELNCMLLQMQNRNYQSILEMENEE